MLANRLNHIEPFHVMEIASHARALCDRCATWATATAGSQNYVRMYVEGAGSDADAFFAYAMAAASNHEPQVMWLPSLPIFKKYHDHARWRALLEKLKFPQA